MRSERSTGIVKALCNCVPHCGNVLFFLSWISDYVDVYFILFFNLPICFKYSDWSSCVEISPVSSIQVLIFTKNLSKVLSC